MGGNCNQIPGSSMAPGRNDHVALQEPRPAFPSEGRGSQRGGRRAAALTLGLEETTVGGPPSWLSLCSKTSAHWAGAWGSSLPVLTGPQGLAKQG